MYIYIYSTYSFYNQFLLCNSQLRTQKQSAEEGETLFFATKHKIT